MAAKKPKEKVKKSKCPKHLKRKQLRTRYWRQHPRQSSCSRAEEQQQRKKTGKKKRNKQAKQKNKVMSSKKPVSRPLMETLWAKFKSRKSPTIQDCYSLSFQFNMTDKQVYSWFYEKRKKYMEEMWSRNVELNEETELRPAELMS